MSEKKQTPEAVSDFLSEEELEELDGKLARMAEETPEMPEDFHARWTEQIRKEAAEKTRSGKRGENRRQWRYILSAAAVFVFLIGGTLLTRSLNAKDAGSSAERRGRSERPTPEISTEAGGSATNGTTFLYDLAPEAEEAAAEIPEPEAVYSAAEALPEDAEMEEAAAADADEAWDNAFEAAGAMGNAAEEAVPASFALKAESASAKNAWPEATATPTPLPASTSSPLLTKAPPAEAPVPEPEKEEAEDGFAGFLKDLGIFTLKTLAVAAAAAALVFLAAVIRRRIRKGK